MAKDQDRKEKQNKPVEKDIKDLKKNEEKEKLKKEVFYKGRVKARQKKMAEDMRGDLKKNLPKGFDEEKKSGIEDKLKKESEKKLGRSVNKKSEDILVKAQEDKKKSISSQEKGKKLKAELKLDSEEIKESSDDLSDLADYPATDGKKTDEFDDSAVGENQDSNFDLGGSDFDTVKPVFEEFSESDNAGFENESGLVVNAEDNEIKPKKRRRRRRKKKKVEENLENVEAVTAEVDSTNSENANQENDAFELQNSNGIDANGDFDEPNTEELKPDSDLTGEIGELENEDEENLEVSDDSNDLAEKSEVENEQQSDDFDFSGDWLKKENSEEFVPQSQLQNENQEFEAEPVESDDIATAEIDSDLKESDDFAQDQENSIQKISADESLAGNLSDVEGVVDEVSIVPSKVPVSPSWHSFLEESAKHSENLNTDDNPGAFAELSKKNKKENDFPDYQNDVVEEDFDASWLNPDVFKDETLVDDSPQQKEFNQDAQLQSGSDVFSGAEEVEMNSEEGGDLAFVGGAESKEVSEDSEVMESGEKLNLGDSKLNELLDQIDPGLPEKKSDVGFKEGVKEIFGELGPRIFSLFKFCAVILVIVVLAFGVYAGWFRFISDFVGGIFDGDSAVSEEQNVDVIFDDAFLPLVAGEIFGEKLYGRANLPDSISSGIYFGEPIDLNSVASGVSFQVAEIFGETDRASESERFAYYVELVGKLRNSYYTDLVQLLDSSADRLATFDAYKAQLNEIYKKSLQIRDEIEAQSERFKSDFDSATDEKNLKEQEYFEFIAQFDGLRADKALNEFIELRVAQEVARTKYNALRALAQEYDRTNEFVSRRLQSLDLNREALLKGVRITPIEGDGFEFVVEQD
jgi:hypothetical protein